MSGRAERTFVVESDVKTEEDTRHLRKPGAGVVLEGVMNFWLGAIA